MIVDADSHSLVQVFVVPIQVVVHRQLMLQPEGLQVDLQFILKIFRRGDFQIEILAAWQMPRWHCRPGYPSWSGCSDGEDECD